jgi:hypothetical protein
MKEIIYKIKELEKLGFFKLADELDSELIKIAQILPKTLMQPNFTLPTVVNNNVPLNTFETAQIRKMLKETKSDSENDTNVLSPGAQNNQNQSTVEKRLNDLLGKVLANERKSKEILNKFPTINSENEIQADDISDNTKKIDNLTTLVGTNEPAETDNDTI